MEKVETIEHATSGSVLVSTNQSDQIVTWAGWVTAPENWHVRHRVQLEADKCRVNIRFYNEQVNGLIFKSRTFSFEVAGVESHVDQFIRYFNLMKERFSQ